MNEEKAILCNWAGHGFVGKQAQLAEVTPDKEVVGELFDFIRFGTISGFFAVDPKVERTCRIQKNSVRPGTANWRGSSFVFQSNLSGVRRSLEFMACSQEISCPV